MLYVNPHKRANCSTTMSRDVRDSALRLPIGRAPTEGSEFTDAAIVRLANAGPAAGATMLVASFSTHSGSCAIAREPKAVTNERQVDAICRGAIQFAPSLACLG